MFFPDKIILLSSIIFILSFLGNFISLKILKLLVLYIYNVLKQAIIIYKASDVWIKSVILSGVFIFPLIWNS